MKKLILLLLVSVSTLPFRAQLLDVINEVFYTDDGSVAGYPVGFTTYRIYARTLDASDWVTSVSGSSICNNIMFLGSSLDGPQVWNVCEGGPLGSDLPADACDVPSLVCFDSFVTIGYAPGSGLSGNLMAVEVPTAEAISNTCFGDSWLQNDYYSWGEFSWFVMPGDAGGVPQPPDNRVLLAQVTIPTGTLSYCLNIQVYDNGSTNLFYVNDPSAYNYDVCASDEITVLDGSTLGLCSESSTDVDGCTDALACNYDSSATTDDGSCTYPGCTDPEACNYDSATGCDDGSCMYPTIVGDLNCDGVIGLEDFLEFMIDFGCTADCGLSDMNGDGVVNVLDLLILMSGCC